jgi:Domain of unknown function (DUF4170)
MMAAMKMAATGKRRPDAMPFWVIGGQYTDTRFAEIAGGGAEARLGPFQTYEEAKAEWARRAWATVDDAHARYRIEHLRK